MTLKQMRYTIEAARCKSFSEAAKKLFLTQPSLTTAIHELEKEIGFSIFIRSRIGIEVTPTGVDFINNITTIIEQVDVMEHQYSKQNKKKNVFSVSAQHYNFASDGFVELIKEKSDSYDLYLLETKTHEIIENIANGVSEIGILYYTDQNEAVIKRELKTMGLVFHKLFKRNPHVFLRCGHPLGNEAGLKQQQLLTYPFVVYNQGIAGSSNFVEEIIDSNRNDKVIYVQDRSTCYRILEETDAYSIGTGILEKDEVRSTVCSIPLLDCGEMYIGWIQKRNTTLSETAQQYLKLIQV